MMQRTRALLVLPVAAAAFLAVAAAPANAQPTNPEINVFEVEAHTLYCQHGGSSCVKVRGNLRNLRFADATVFRFSPLKGVTKGSDDAVGTPEVVHAVRARHYRASNSDVHARAIDFTGARSRSRTSPPPRFTAKRW